MKVAKAKAALHPSSGDVDSGQSNLLESPHPISFAYSFIHSNNVYSQLMICARHWSYNSEPKIKHPFICRVYSLVRKKGNRQANKQTNKMKSFRR